MRRRLRYQPRRQSRHSRIDRARASQRDIRDGSGPRRRTRRGRRIAGHHRQECPLRHRAARDIDRSLSSPDNAFHVPALSQTVALKPVAAARFGDRPRGSSDATRSLPRHVQPRTGFRRRPPACAALSAATRRFSGGSEGKGARRLGSPGKTQSAASPTARFAQSAVARLSQHAISTPRSASRCRL